MTENSEGLSKILDGIGLPFEILLYNEELEGYLAEIRTVLPRAESYSLQCDQWISKFSLMSNTNWIVVKTFPSPLVMYKYRKYYNCHHSDRYKAKDQDKNGKKSKGKTCSASVNIVVKRNTVNTRKKDRFMKQGLDTLIKINFVHSHRVDEREALGCLRVNDETRNLFYSYFNQGMSVPEAKKHHVRLLKSFGYSKDPHHLSDVNNTATNPKVRQLYHLHEKWRREQNKPKYAEDARYSVPSMEIQSLPECQSEFRLGSPEVIIVGFTNEEPCVRKFEPCLADATSEYSEAHDVIQKETLLKEVDECLQKIGSLARNATVDTLQTLLENLRYLQTPERLGETARLLQRRSEL